MHSTFINTPDIHDTTARIARHIVVAERHKRARRLRLRRAITYGIGPAIAIVLFTVATGIVSAYFLEAFSAIAR